MRSVPEGIDRKSPWQEIRRPPAGLEAELRRETPPGHVRSAESDPRVPHTELFTTADALRDRIDADHLEFDDQ